MKVEFRVKVDIQPAENQPKKEFEKEDGKVMVEYLAEEIEHWVIDKWCNNAHVTSVNVTKIRKNKRK